MGYRAGPSRPSARRGSHAARRASAAATSPAGPAAPAGTPPRRRTQPSQPRLPLCRPPRGPPRGRPLMAGGRLLAAQPVLDEPVGHGGRVHAKLPCDLPKRPSPLGDPVGEAQRVGTILEVALLAVDHGEAVAEGQTVG